VGAARAAIQPLRTLNSIDLARILQTSFPMLWLSRLQADQSPLAAASGKTLPLHGDGRLTGLMNHVVHRRGYKEISCVT
jgi:hypothetical protein